MTDITRSNRVHIYFSTQRGAANEFHQTLEKSDRAMQVVGSNYKFTVTTYLIVLDTQYYTLSSHFSWVAVFNLNSLYLYLIARCPSIR